MLFARVLLITFLFVGLSLIHLTLSTKRIDLEYQIEKLSEERDHWKEKREFLVYEVARLEALPRIEQFAKVQRGMVRPKQFIFYIVPSKETASKKHLEKRPH